MPSWPTIITYPDPRLRQRAEPVAEVTSELLDRARTLIPLMHAEGGIGLAATQVGWLERVVVIWTSCFGDLVFLNPVIERRYGGKETAVEGCLSVPGIHAEVERDGSVSVKAWHLNGNDLEEMSLEAHGLSARCFQHEIDHLDGILFIDRLTPERRAAVEPVLRKLERRP